MKNENVHMQALHRKLYVVLVQILPYNNVQKPITAFVRFTFSRTPPFTQMRVSHSDHISPRIFFSLCHPCTFVPVWCL